MLSAITISLVPEARGGPFVFWDNLVDGCDKALELGFDAVEIFPRSPEEFDIRLLQYILEDRPLKVAAVGTGAGWVVRKLRLTDPNPDIRRQAREFIAEIIYKAGSFRAPAIIGSMQGRWDADTGREQALEWLREALAELAPMAAKQELPLLLEPLNRYETNMLNRVGESLEFLGSVGSDNVKLLCDLFHMNIEEANPAEALRLAGPKVGHVHFADSNRQAIGSGHTEMAPIVAALRDIGYDGYISGEILPLPDSESAARRTIESFRKWFPAPAPIC